MVDGDLACLGSVSEILGPTCLYGQVLRYSTKSSPLKFLCTPSTIYNIAEVCIICGPVLSLVCVLSQIPTCHLFQ